MIAAPLILNILAVAKLSDLREVANKHPIDMLKRVDDIKSPAGMAAHMRQMNAQTVTIPGPWPFEVTFSVETGHPAGVCRHMSMSIRRKGRAPSPEATWIVAEHLGFVGSLAMCRMWPEKLSDGEVAINLVQPVDIAAEIAA